jgi:AraC-like DNA-binding protein
MNWKNRTCAASLARPLPDTQNRAMHESVGPRKRLAPSASTESAVAAVFVDEFDRDMSLVAIPRPEIHLAVRFGPSARRGLDIHALGSQQKVHRKVIRAGQRIVMVRLHLGASEELLGVPASVIAGHVVDLDELWGDEMTRRLLDRLSVAQTTIDAAAVFESAIAERLLTVDSCSASSHLARKAAERLVNAPVNTVAVDLGVSERHLRRVFSNAIGVGPKAFAKLTRFHRALRAAHEDASATWASIAAESGYYDQAHLVEEFRAIAGVSPRALLRELRPLRVGE